MENTNFRIHAAPRSGIRFCRFALPGPDTQDGRSAFGPQNCDRPITHVPSRTSHIQSPRFLPNADPEISSIQALADSRHDLSVVRYQPIIVPSAGRWQGVFFAQWIAIGMAILTGCYCLLRVTDRFAALEATDAHRGQALGILTKTIKDEDSRLEYKREEVNELARYLLSSTPAAARRNSYSEQQDDRRLDKALGIIEQLLAAKSPSSDAGKRNPAIESSQSTPTDFGDKSREGGTSEEYHFDPTIPLVSGAVIHRKNAGEADYWLVARPDQPGVTDRVIPFAITGLGVAVHSIDDSHDYIVTTAGKWLRYGL